MKNRRICKKALSILLFATLLLSGMPIFAYAEEMADPLCPHHPVHTAECGYTESSEGMPCTHVHDNACGYVEPVEEIPCDKGCNETDAEVAIIHRDGCAYAPAVEGFPCRHQHDDSCGYSPAVEGAPCAFVCEICDLQEDSKPEDNPDGDECICTVLCTEGAVNAECPVCDVDLSDCEGEEAVDSVTELQERINNLPSAENFLAMEKADQAAVVAEYRAILAAIDALGEAEAETLDRTNLNNLTKSVMKNTGIDRTIVEDSANLSNGEANIEKHSDREYTISYPGATEDTPLKYQEDFVNRLGKFGFSAEVVNVDGTPVTEQPRSLNINNTKGGLDYSEITTAKDDNGNIKPGSYTMTLDFSKIGSDGSASAIVNAWKTIGFANGSQVVTIHVVVGTEWGDSFAFDPYRIKTVSPDNVTFNLFDYWVDGETAHTHLNEGWRQSTLATCGIPSCIGETQKVIEKNNVAGSGYENTGYYNKGINENHALVFSPAGNLTGGWNFNTNNKLGESYLEFNGGPYYGLVQNKLGADGYPVLKLDQKVVDSKVALQGQDRPADESLAYLFSPKDGEGKRVYTDADGLLKRDPETGYYKYSSLENFASYNRATGDFDVYNSPAVSGGASVDGQFFPLNTAAQVFEVDADGDPKIEEGILVPNDANGTNDAFLNHYLGLTMEVTFQQPVDGKISNMGKETPMTFRFSGDDDVWIFIDGVLVADIGGIHDTQTATIDFSTGEILIDRTERFPKENEKPKNTTLVTTIQKQFEKAGELNKSEMNGNTFGDNTVHTLTMFYMERGNQASNLELEFNLQEPQYNRLEKVDQDGIGLEGVTFDLYEANEDWQPINPAAPLATLTTDEDGTVDFAVEGSDGVKRVIVFDEAKKYVLRERQKPRGFVTQGDIHLTYHAKSGTLKVANKWETGAVGGFMAQLTMTGALKSELDGTDLTEAARDGLIIAIPMYNPIHHGETATEGWLPLYGSVYDGFQVIEMDGNADAEAYSKATMEAAFRQFANPEYEHWHLYWNEELQRYDGTLNDLPGAVEDYIFIDKEKGNVLTAYYLFNPKDNLFDGCTTDEQKCEKLAELVKGKDEEAIQKLVEDYNEDFVLLNMDGFNRQFYSRLYIPNKARDLWVQKQDENGKPLAGAEFTLYSDAACTTPVAKGITDENGYISFSAQNTGNNAVTKPEGGLSSEVYYPLMRNFNDGKITDKKLWLKETKAPEDYDINPTVTKVLISRDYLYADAGNTTDDVSVARGLGALVETMVSYASDGAIDITLRDITATEYKYNGKLDSEGFPTVENLTWEKVGTPLNLHFGLTSSLLDYGLHEEGKAPAFVAEEGWHGIGVAQNWDAHQDQEDPYHNPLAKDENLKNTDISALFTGSTTIIYQDKKKDTPDPDPDPKTGSLQVTKHVTGSRGDYSREFPIKVELSDKTINGQYGEMLFQNGISNFTLRDNESITATGLPADVTYTVTETDAYGHVVSYSGATGTITANSTAYAKVSNHKDGGDGGGDGDEIDVTVSKIWKLDNGGKRPESVRVELLRNGAYYAHITLSEDNNWTYTWQGLDDSYSWSVQEADVPDGFVATVERNRMTFTITNDDQPGNPDDPDEPNDPDVPGEPDTPTELYQPGDPDVPGAPGIPAGPDQPNEPKLPQTGVGSRWLLAGLLGTAGVVLLLFGIFGKKRYHGKREA